MVKQNQVCDDILNNKCKKYKWGSIENILDNKDFEVITAKRGSSVSITHIKMKQYKALGKLHGFLFDSFTIHAHQGKKTILHPDDCKRIKNIMIQLDLKYC